VTKVLQRIRIIFVEVEVKKLTLIILSSITDFWDYCAKNKMETVLITGGSGLLGKQLCRKLSERGYEPAILTRKPDNKSDITNYYWDPDKKEIDNKAISSADHIIHLSGVNIGNKRWTKRRKELIMDSRILPAELLFDKIKESGKNLKSFISISGTGYYGSITSEKIFTETDGPAEDFLGNVCSKWERTAERFEEIGIRTVRIRSAVVLTKKGGVLSRLSTLVKMRIGSAIGRGSQYFPWIHIDDLCNIFIKAFEDPQMRGAYNGVAPDCKTNKEFVRTLAHVMKKPFWFPGIPAILMKILFGEMSLILLTGSRISSEKIEKAGYVFKFPVLEGALKDLLKK
jgi:hypothetical protein